MDFSMNIQGKYSEVANFMELSTSWEDVNFILIILIINIIMIIIIILNYKWVSTKWQWYYNKAWHK
jgi:hypothetical protein